MSNDDMDSMLFVRVADREFEPRRANQKTIKLYM
jgi:hypothetical protein